MEDPGVKVLLCRQMPIKGRIQLSDTERQTLTDIGQKLGKQVLAEIAKAVQLAAAIEVNTRGINLGLPVLTLISADGELSGAATTEGLTVEDPNIH
jgi:hypothetical protein